MLGSVGAPMGVVREARSVFSLRHSRRPLALLALALQLAAGPLAVWSHNHAPHAAHDAHGHARGAESMPAEPGQCCAHDHDASAARARATSCPFAARRAAASDSMQGAADPGATRADSLAPCAACEFLAQRMMQGGWSPTLDSILVRWGDATPPVPAAPPALAAHFFARGPPA